MEKDAFSRLEWRIFRVMANVRLAGFEFTHKLNSLISRGAFKDIFYRTAIRLRVYIFLLCLLAVVFANSNLCLC